MNTFLSILAQTMPKRSKISIIPIIILFQKEFNYDINSFVNKSIEIVRNIAPLKFEFGGGGAGGVERRKAKFVLSSTTVWLFGIGFRRANC